MPHYIKDPNRDHSFDNHPHMCIYMYTYIHIYIHTDVYNRIYFLEQLSASSVRGSASCAAIEGSAPLERAEARRWYWLPAVGAAVQSPICWPYSVKINIVSIVVVSCASTMPQSIIGRFM